MDVSWILESNVFAEECFDQMVDHFKANSIPYEVVRIIPFAHTIEGKKPVVSGPVVAYGSLGIHKLAKAEDWIPGVWWSEDYNETVLAKRYPFTYLNDDLEVMKLGEVLHRRHDDFLFIKPNTDSKEFAGQVFRRDELSDWYQKLVSAGYFDYDILDLDVVVSSPKDIGTEWRTVVVDGKVVSSSIYRQYQKVLPEYDMDPEVIRFVESIVDDRLPPVIVVDVCETKNGLKVIEMNSANSSGWYMNRVDHIIDAINQYVEKTY